MLLKLKDKNRHPTDHYSFLYGHLGPEFIKDISSEDVIFGTIGHSGYPTDEVRIAFNKII